MDWHGFEVWMFPPLILGFIFTFVSIVLDKDTTFHYEIKMYRYTGPARSDSIK
jgi:hypothetical protein